MIGHKVTGQQHAHGVDKFACIPPDTTIENKYYGVYDKLLNEVFDTSATNYIVELQPALPEAFQAPGVPSVDFVITYIVMLDKKPVFFLK
jgi:hypothetical protein